MVETFFQQRPMQRRPLIDRRNGLPGRRPGPSVSLVIPALNEAGGLRAVLPRVPRIVEELIVIDGGSTDDTVEVVREVSPHAIVIHQTGRGKGDALKCGIAAARGDVIVTMDADGSMNPEDITLFVRSLLAGNDFVKGSRALPGAGSDDFTLV